jgi:hypothetical protein
MKIEISIRNVVMLSNSALLRIKLEKCPEGFWED